MGLPSPHSTALGNPRRETRIFVNCAVNLDSEYQFQYIHKILSHCNNCQLILFIIMSLPMRLCMLGFCSVYNGQSLISLDRKGQRQSIDDVGKYLTVLYILPFFKFLFFVTETTLGIVIFSFKLMLILVAEPMLCNAGV